MSDEGQIAHHLADRGRMLLLGVLVVFCAISAVVGVGQLLSGSKAAIVPIVRFGLAVLLAYFVYQGALAARIILAALSVVAALVMLYTLIVVSLPRLDIAGAVTLTVLAGYYVLAAWAVFKSEPILAFWASRLPEADTATPEQRTK